MEQRVLSNRPSSRRTEAFNCSLLRMRRGRSRSSQSGTSIRRSKSSARAPAIGLGSAITRWSTDYTERNLCNLWMDLRVDVLGQIPLGIDVTLFRTLGLLSVEVPRDVVVVHRDGLDRLVAAAAANRH